MQHLSHPFRDTPISAAIQRIIPKTVWCWSEAELLFPRVKKNKKRARVISPTLQLLRKHKVSAAWREKHLDPTLHPMQW